MRLMLCLRFFVMIVSISSFPDGLAFLIFIFMKITVKVLLRVALFLVHQCWIISVFTFFTASQGMLAFNYYLPGKCMWYWNKDCWFYVYLFNDRTLVVISKKIFERGERAECCRYRSFLMSLHINDKYNIFAALQLLLFMTFGFITNLNCTQYWVWIGYYLEVLSFG